MICARCDHPIEKHCKSNIEHVYFKDEHLSKPRKTLCKTRHCLCPLCSCVDYVSPQGDQSK